MPLTGLNAAGLVLEFEEGYRAGLITMNMMNGPLYASTPWDSLFVDVPTDNTVIDQVNVQEEARFQAFQTAFLPLGGMKFTPNSIPLRHIMLESELMPDVIAGTAIDFLAQQNLQRGSAPIVGIWLQAMLRSAINRFHKYENYKGVKGAITEGVSTLEGQSINGVREVLRIARTDVAAEFHPHVLTPVGYATVPDDAIEYVNYIEAWWDLVPQEIKELALPIAISKERLKLFKTGLAAKYQSGSWNKLGYIIDIESFTEKLYMRSGTLIGLPNMDGSNKVWLTVKRNAVRGLKNSNNLEQWAVGIKDLKKVQASKDYWVGYGFLNYDWVFENGVN